MYIILIFFMQLQKVEFRKNYLNTISDQLFHPLDEVLIVFDCAYTSPKITDESDQGESNESSNDPNRVKKLLVPEICWRSSEV